MKLTCANRVAHKYVLLFLVVALFQATTANATVFSVSSTADSGANTLRAAILAANLDIASPHTINISIAGTGPFTISLLTALPAISKPTTISASAEAISGAPGVRLARGAVFTAPGLQFAATAGNSSVSWLSITDFTGYGIDIVSGAGNVAVSNCYVGIAPDGVTDAGNSTSGIHVAGGSAVIGNGAATRNVISGNGAHGIVVDAGGSLSVIRGNYIGTNALGDAAIANAVSGIQGLGGDDVTIGSTVAGDGNLISGNGVSGINIGAAAGLWKVRGNLIGTRADGTVALKNGAYGVIIAGDNHLIGGNDANSRNVISGNNSYGISLVAGADNITIRANYIGTNAAGTATLGTQQRGISVVGALTGCVIGGTSTDHRNVISGNTSYGILTDSDVSGCVISGNFIGLNAAGTAAVANAAGVELQGTTMVLGGDTDGERNIISGNTNNGVGFWGSNNKAQGNYIGTNPAGTAAIPNGAYGIGVLATGGTIGGTNAGEANLISGNTNNGINTTGNTTGLVIAGNFIGTNAAGTGAVPNATVGVWLRGNGNTLGGTTAAARNLISGNTQNGVIVQGTGNIIQGNFIGTNTGGTAALPNGSGGIRAITATGAVIGGAVAGVANLISGNASNGISLDGDTSAAVISGNLIGTNAAGTGAVPNVGSGIAVNGSGHIVGGTTALARNVISGNAFQGIVLSGTNNNVRGNYIGTKFDASGAVGNSGGGIRAITSTGGTIGGTAANAGNVISGNSSNGITLDNDTSSLVITGNVIGLNPAGTDLGNLGSGVVIDGTNHTLGGNTPEARNLISGNDSQGVVLGGSNNVVRGNYIGTDALGSLARANGGYGIRIYEATGGEVGGAAVADGNLISGNGRGISIEHSSTAIVVRNNIIGLNAALNAKLPNHGSGVEIFTNGNTVGTAGAGNVISGNDSSGIVVSGYASGNTIRGNWIGTNKVSAVGLGNFGGGIYMTDGLNNIIGGQAAGEGNVIAYNQYVGAWVQRGDGNDFSRNSIFENDRLGLDIGDQALELNDAGDPDITGNRRQNFPLLTSVVQDGNTNTTKIDGILKNEPDTQYRVEFFTSPNCDATGMGEGKTFAGTVNVTTGPDGTGVLAANLALTAIPFMSATVTDPQGNTSEFSPCAKTTGPNPGTIQFYDANVLSYEGVLPTAKVIITRSQGMAGTVTANFTISDLSAFAGTDYVDADQVVTFLDGEVLKIVTITLIADPAVELTEHANLVLAGPTGGAVLGTAFSDMYIFDEDLDFPGIIVDDASITEGNSGQKQLTFNVRMSASNHPVSVAFLTEHGTAVAGSDYTDLSGTVDFLANASAQTKTVNVQISGDNTVELDETFWLRVTCGVDCSNWIAYDVYGLGLIVNDDGIGPPSEDIFKDSFEDPPP